MVWSCQAGYSALALAAAARRRVSGPRSAQNGEGQLKVHWPVTHARPCQRRSIRRAATRRWRAFLPSYLRDNFLLGAPRRRTVCNYLFNSKPRLLRELDEFLRIIVCTARRAIPYNKGDDWQGLARPSFSIGTC